METHTYFWKDFSYLVHSHCSQGLMKGGHDFSKETESNVYEGALLSKREVIRNGHLCETIIVFFQHVSVRGRSAKEWGERGDTSA